MIKSVFIKYMLAFFAIITISFTILACVLCSNVIQYSIDAQKVSMVIATNFAKQSIETSFNRSGFYPYEFDRFVNESKDDMTRVLSTYSVLTEASLILLTDVNGNMLVTTTLPEHYLQKESVPENILANVLNQNNFAEYQTLDGLFATRHLVFPQMLVSKEGEVYGVLFFCSASVMANSLAGQMIITIILSCLWVLVATMMTIYIITEKIVSPVRAMIKAARSFALGNFEVRVAVKGNNDEIGELASTFNDMAASLAVNEETQRMFLANVAHDLRTPMTNIAGYVDGILDGAVPLEKLNIVSTEIRRLSKFVSSLLEISKMQAGERKISKTNFDICEMARQAIIFLEHKIESKHLEFEFDSDDYNMYVSADSLTIRQVLDNLLENAIKFTPEKGLIKVNITAGEDEKEKKLFVSVYNTGTGISSEEIPFIFNRLYKSDQSRGLDPTGVGLGLFIVKTIIDSHEEKIWIDSEYEKYCKFTFTLQKATGTGNRQKL